jgi:hypothetical protein
MENEYHQIREILTNHFLDNLEKYKNMYKSFKTDPDDILNDIITQGSYSNGPIISIAANALKINLMI